MDGFFLFKYTRSELLDEQQGNDVEVLFIFVEDRFNKVKYFLDFLKLKLILFDNSDDF